MYVNYGLSLTNNQKKKIVKAVMDGSDVMIQLNQNNFRGDDMLHLTSQQIKKINKGVGFRLHLSKSQLKPLHSKIPKEKTGGFLPLLTLLPLIFGGLGAAGGVDGGVASAISSAKANVEQARHNKVVEDELAKSGSGVLQKLGLGTHEIKKVISGGCVDCGGLCFQKFGNGLFLAPYSGNGLFLAPYRP